MRRGGVLIMIKGLAHNAFKVKDMERSLHFYCDVIGLEKAFDIKDEEGNPWIIYLKISDTQFIELFYGGTEESEVKSDIVGYHHFCFEVDDINEIAKKIEDHGYKMDSKPAQGYNLNYNCWVTDPDGNGVEFIQLNPDSPLLKF
jgi:catechol 2,3-dioxygenase-like lactoylglutathione lyase family enzyme